LIESGADFTAADWKGRTPLELADSGKSQTASASSAASDQGVQPTKDGSAEFSRNVAASASCA
jgi:hypothetical protein